MQCSFDDDVTNGGGKGEEADDAIPVDMTETFADEVRIDKTDLVKFSLLNLEYIQKNNSLLKHCENPRDNSTAILFLFSI